MDDQFAGIGRRTAGSTTELQITGRAGVPSGATAALLNVTAVLPDSGTFITLFPCGGRPEASNLNSPPGDIRANSAYVKLTAKGTVCIYTVAATDIVVDINGYTPGDVSPPVQPARLLDTRPGNPTVDGTWAGIGRRSAGSTIELPVAGRAGVPVNATAALLNVTAVLPDSGTFITLFPCGERPEASNLNSPAGDIRANSAYVKLSGTGTVCIYTVAATDIVVDVNGYTPGDLSPTSLPPARVLETRPGNRTIDGQFAGLGRRKAGSTTEVKIAGRAGVPSSATAALLNVTAVLPDAGTFITLFPCGERPEASNLNSPAGDIRANSAYVKLSPTGTVCIYTVAATDIVVDINGYTRLPPPTGAFADLGVSAVSTTNRLYPANWAEPESELIYPVGASQFRAATVNATAKTIEVATYDVLNGARGATQTISYQDWPLFGGMYAAPNGDLYLLVGRDNAEESITKEVMAVRRYSPNLVLLGEARLSAAATQYHKGTYKPFLATSSDMTLVGNRLVVHTARQLFILPDGLRHQMNLTFEVNVDTMTASTFEQLGGRTGYQYSAHSFRQQTLFDGKNLYLLDHSDAYPRSIQLGVMQNYPAQRTVKSYDVFRFNGKTGDNFTGATMSRMSVSRDRVLILGTSIPHPDAPNGPLLTTNARNVYLLVVDPTTGAVDQRWLTNFTDPNIKLSEARLIQIDSDRFAVLYSSTVGAQSQLQYLLVNGRGDVLASTTFNDMTLNSRGAPALVGSTIVWTASINENGAGVLNRRDYLYEVDVSNPSAPFIPS